MSNYPTGAEHDSNAPFNKPESKGEYVCLFDEILENALITKDVSDALSKFDKDRQEAQKILIELIQVANDIDNSYFKNKLFKVKELISEPQLFIEE